MEQDRPEACEPGTALARPEATDGDLRRRRGDSGAAFLAAGNPRAALRAAATLARQDARATLALVLETEGSTYVRAGAMAVFAQDMQVGWLSGGCLEPELARRAMQADAAGSIEWIEVDTREDEALFSGSAMGCRGRLRIALLPLRALRGVEALFEAWIDGGATLHRSLATDGLVQMAANGISRAWQVPAGSPSWASDSQQWQLPLPRPPEALLLGAGPETHALLGLLHDLGWRTSLVERRPRWRDCGDRADARFDTASDDVLRAGRTIDAALVMHHSFELDRDALEALAATSIPFVGLLGPPRRRDDLFKLLTPAQRDALSARLRSPVGLDLGGEGAEAIALSIAAQLQDWRANAGRT
jgi:xanthine dehydrogenase accessory factor